MKKILKKILPNFLVLIIRKYLQKKIDYHQSKILNNISGDFKNISYINSTNILSELSEKYGTDKGFINIDSKKPYSWMPHSYTSYYHSIFGLSRENIKLIFECGIGTNNLEIKANMTKNASPGASLRMWRDYFINADIYGGDIDKNILFGEERIKTFFVDQLNTNSIKSMWEKINLENFDIIIDDGLHDPKANLNFFFNSFNKVKKNGIYIIEDVSNQNINFMQKELKNYETEIVTLSNKHKKIYNDNNLVIVRKN